MDTNDIAAGTESLATRARDKCNSWRRLATVVPSLQLCGDRVAHRQCERVENFRPVHLELKAGWRVALVKDRIIRSARVAAV